MWYKNIAGRCFGLVTKHACDGRTDRQTDRQNYDSQDRTSIAASHGKKPTGDCWSDIFYRPDALHQWCQSTKSICEHTEM